MMELQPKSFSSEYHIDSNDRLIYVDEGWHKFARKNAAPELASDSVLSKPLWNFIADSEVQHLYKMLLAKVRQTGKSVRLSYRCDAPHARRFLEMIMIPDAEAGVQFHNWLLREEEREPIELLGVTAKRSDELLIICSWCKQVKLDEETWVEVEEAAQRLGLFEATELPKLSHSMCPKCAQTWRAAG